MINIDYKYSTVYSDVNHIILSPNSTYIYGYSTENRSHVVDILKDKYQDSTSFIQLELIDEEKDIVENKLSSLRYSLRSKENIKSLLNSYPSQTLYIDVSGLNNRISAALLNNILPSESDVNVVVLYAEPESYKIKQFKSESVYIDLSEKINGIEPLPGFANIIPDDIDYKFIALLGFEGGRFTHLVNNIQPAEDNIIPIIGVPGYRMEYPFVAYWGNRNALTTTGSWANIKYAAANSLVDIYMLLKKIHKKNPKSKIKLAPIGTKPHAIGAILFAIKHPREVELVYDNPKRKIERTSGVGSIVVCEVSKLLKEN
ncbi:MAG: hypothetical protein LRY34_03490 [Bacteroides graminisolvens]|nr:hypothetical protein [Bacteroides graminisolvens]